MHAVSSSQIHERLFASALTTRPAETRPCEGAAPRGDARRTTRPAVGFVGEAGDGVWRRDGVDPAIRRDEGGNLGEEWGGVCADPPGWRANEHRSGGPQS
jgi:hypothetical protein